MPASDEGTMNSSMTIFGASAEAAFMDKNNTVATTPGSARIFLPQKDASGDDGKVGRVHAGVVGRRIPYGDVAHVELPEIIERLQQGGAGGRPARVLQRLHRDLGRGI